MATLLDRQLRGILEAASDGILVEEGERIAYLNPAYARMLGYPSTTDLYSATIRDIADPEDFERLLWFGRCRREGKPAPDRYTFHARGRNRQQVTFDATISQTRLDGHLLITTIVRELIESRGEKPLEEEVPGLKRLSVREAEVLRHVLAGLRSKEIANLLNVSEKTIATHRCRAFRKLSVRNDRDLFRVAAEHGAI
ncbi:MAG: LuxR C-terminal-related transcriptional regulator [Acidobacteriota bacterium]